MSALYLFPPGRMVAQTPLQTPLLLTYLLTSNILSNYNNLFLHFPLRNRQSQYRRNGPNDFPVVKHLPKSPPIAYLEFKNNTRPRNPQATSRCHYLRLEIETLAILLHDYHCDCHRQIYHYRGVDCVVCKATEGEEVGEDGCGDGD